MYKLLSILLGLTILVGRSHGATGTIPGGGGGGGGGGGSSTGSGSSIGGSFQAWDDFEGLSGGMAEILARRQTAPYSLPDRQNASRVVWYGTSGNTIGSNAISVANGEWQMDVARAGGTGIFDSGVGGNTNIGYHLFASNTFGGGVGCGWSRIHGTWYYTNSGVANGGLLNCVMILGPATCLKSPGGGLEASPQGDFLHINWNYASCTVSRGTTADYIINETFPNQLMSGIEYDTDVQVVSNTVFMRVGPYSYSGTHSNANLWAGNNSGAIADWEVFGQPSNQVKSVWRSIAVGYAESWAWASASGNKGMGTNFTSSGRVLYKPTLTTNTYLLNQNDGIVINGSPGTSTTLVTNKLPYLTTTPANTITIADGTTTAAGSNIWILTIDGTKINNATTATNITANNGSYTFVATPTGWQIIAKQ